MASGTDPLGRTCPYCGATITAEDFFCRACHKRFELQGAETDPTKLQELPEGSVLSLKNPILSAALSFIGMGLGQFYNGDTVKGLLFNAVYLPLVLGLISIPSSREILLALWAISVAEAALTSWRINRLIVEYDGPSLLYYILLVILAGILAWYMVSGDAAPVAKKLFPPLQFLL
jgi:TM2 domain-containing membrane protein YozV